MERYTPHIVRVHEVEVEMDIEAAVEQIFKLYDDYGNEDYIGEPVTQTEHMVQCAMLAEAEGCTEEVILGALLHDIGHLLGLHRGMERMETNGTVLGAAKHELLGEQFVRDLGLPEVVCELIRGHVDAKRYLVFKDEDYRKKLSEASTMTLVHQGGPMSAQEAAVFESSPNHQAILRMRSWDERGKVVGMEIEPLSKYREMCRRVLARNRAT